MKLVLTLVSGHRIDGRPYEFVHLCPGQGCAIAEWFIRHDQRVIALRELGVRPNIVAS